MCLWMQMFDPKYAHRCCWIKGFFKIVVSLMYVNLRLWPGKYFTCGCDLESLSCWKTQTSCQSFPAVVFLLVLHSWMFHSVLHVWGCSFQVLFSCGKPTNHVMQIRAEVTLKAETDRLSSSEVISQPPGLEDRGQKTCHGPPTTSWLLKKRGSSFISIYISKETKQLVYRAVNMFVSAVNV